MASTTKKMKKKQAKKLVKPITRSSNKPFESDAAEVKASVRGPENHLEKNVKDEDIPQVERDQFRAEAEAITNDISKELTTVGKTPPRLRDMSKATNMPGALTHNPAAADSGQAAPNLRSTCTLHELGVEQPLPTATCEDKNGTRMHPKPNNLPDAPAMC